MGDSYSGGSSYSKSNSLGVQHSESQSGERYEPWQKDILGRQLSLLEQRLQGGQPQSFASYFAQAGGQPVNVPDIPIVQAYTPNQIAARTNQFFAEGAQKTGTDWRQNALSAAGRGFGTNSPLLAELNAAASGRNYRTGVEQSTNFELGAADRNAGLALQSWLGRLSGAQVASNDDIRRRQLAVALQGQDIQRENALLNALNFNLRPLSFSQSVSDALNKSASESASAYASASEG